MTEPKQPKAAVVESLKGALSEDGQFALIRATRPGAVSSGADDIDLAIPAKLLPKVLGLVLHLIESADAQLPSPEPGTSRRRCFDAAAVASSEIGDGRQALTFELVLGGKIAIAVDDEGARKISEALARQLAGDEFSPTTRKDSLGRVDIQNASLSPAGRGLG